MTERVQTTAIKKKYKDKKTGEWKELTINHAKVKDRLNAFWEANPRGKIETSQIKEEDQRIFKTLIIADKSDPYSREATGHSYGSVGDEKAFEKLETISVGRALALLGYSTDGEIASSEEMEEFKTYQDEKAFDIIKDIQGFTKLEDLRTYFISLGAMMNNPDVMKAKDAKKAELQNANN